MIPVIARIVLRYLSGALVSYGLIPVETGAALAIDQDMALVIGTAIGAVTEGVYAWVKTRGGKT